MLCLSGFELYYRWVPLRDHATVAYGLKKSPRLNF